MFLEIFLYLGQKLFKFFVQVFQMDSSIIKIKKYFWWKTTSEFLTEKVVKNLKGKSEIWFLVFFIEFLFLDNNFQHSCSFNSNQILLKFLYRKSTNFGPMLVFSCSNLYYEKFNQKHFRKFYIIKQKKAPKTKLRVRNWIFKLIRFWSSILLLNTLKMFSRENWNI